LKYFEHPEITDLDMQQNGIYIVNHVSLISPVHQFIFIEKHIGQDLAFHSKVMLKQGLIAVVNTPYLPDLSGLQSKSSYLDLHPVLEENQSSK